MKNYWIRRGRPPHFFNTKRERKWGFVTHSLVLALATVGAVCAWPHWSVALFLLFGAGQAFGLISIYAEHSWTKRYGHPDRDGDTSNLYSLNKALKREAEVDSGRASQFYKLH